MKRVLLISLLAIGAYALDYKVSGTVESFSKVGFNNQALNTATGAAPTESFTTIFSKLNLNANLGGNFKLGLGGALGGLAYDSTDGNDPNKPWSAVYGAYYGVSWDKNKKQNYMIHNAFLEYSGEALYFKAGRYQSGKVGEYFSGLTQGAEAYVKASALKVWGFFSNRRGFAYDQWFNDFYKIFGSERGGKYNLYALGADVDVSGLNVSVFSYYVPWVVTAPGLGITFKSNPSFSNSGFNATTKFRFIAPRAGVDKVGRQSGRNWGEINKQSYTLHLEQKFDIDRIFFGAGVYKNIGNANELIGRYGNPISLDIWTAGAYDIGQALNDIVGKDAMTGYGFVGGKYTSFDWKFIVRGTNSPRSAEQSVGLLLNYAVREDFNIGGKLEWFSDTTKAGYNPNIFSSTTALTQKRTDDRSHIFFYMNHSF